MTDQVAKVEGEHEGSGVDYSHLTINILELHHKNDEANEEQYDMNYDSEDQSPISPLDSVLNRNQEVDDYFGSVPRLVIYGDYSGKSDHSLDFHLEEEIDTAQQIQQLLRTLNEKLSGDELDSLIVDEYEEETVISDNSFPRRTFGKKTQKMLTAELNNYCKEWRSQFCYVGVNGISLVKEVSLETQQISLESAQKEEAERDGKQLAVYGGLEEEIIEIHGEYEEIIAIDVTEQSEIKQKNDKFIQKQKVYKRRGFPPLEPEQAVKDSILSNLFQRIWRDMVEGMKPLLGTHLLSHISSTQFKKPALDKLELRRDFHIESYAQNTPSSRVLMKPSKKSKDQTIQFGLDHAVRVRSYKPSTADTMDALTYRNDTPEVPRKRVNEVSKKDFPRRKHKRANRPGGFRNHTKNAEVPKERREKKSKQNINKIFPAISTSTTPFTRMNTMERFSVNLSYSNDLRFPMLADMKSPPETIFSKPMSRAQTAIITNVRSKRLLQSTNIEFIMREPTKQQR